MYMYTNMHIIKLNVGKLDVVDIFHYFSESNKFFFQFMIKSQILKMFNNVL